MAQLLDSLTLPFRAYEAAVPFSLWLMALCTPMLLAVAKRQDDWIDAVVTLRTCVYLLIGRKIP